MCMHVILLIYHVLFTGVLDTFLKRNSNIMYKIDTIIVVRKMQLLVLRLSGICEFIKSSKW